MQNTYTKWEETRAKDLHTQEDTHPRDNENNNTTNHRQPCNTRAKHVQQHAKHNTNKQNQKQ